MYGYDDFYNSPEAFRSHRRSRGPLLPVEHELDKIAEQAADETSVEMYGAFNFNLSNIGSWAKGLVDPRQRLKNWKRTLRKHAKKWHSYDRRGDSQADKIAAQMLGLAAKIIDRQPDWEAPEGTADILARYADGKSMGFTRKEKREARREERKTRRAERRDEGDDSLADPDASGATDLFEGIGNTVAGELFGFQ